VIGRALAHYRITAAIGAGGMGEVYRATDTKLGRDVALKILPPGMASSPERLERFQREAKALAALDHPGIVTVYSVEEAGGVHFLTMQLVEGQSLDRVIPEGGLPPDRLLELAMALAEALAAAHDRGIVHRDLKPANVMVGAGGRVKVLDFGLARMSGPRAEEPIGSELPTEFRTQEGVVMGTAPYMSPEQLSGLELDHRTDLFSLGVTLYEMATGRRPFLGRSSAELASAILRDRALPLAGLRKDLPEGLTRAIERCLEKNAADRFPSARDLCDVLRGVAGQAPPARTPVPPVPRPVEAADSGEARAGEGFWVAVLPFRHRGSDPGLEGLAEGLTEDVVTGLSRFSYLRVVSRSSTSRYAQEAVDVRTVGREIGARYVMEGSLRQVGAQLRVAVQLVDAGTGGHLWAETYTRPYQPDQVFAVQDDLVPRIVSTSADHFGVLARAISEAVRGRPLADLTPYEALMRGFGYHFRLSPEEHAEAREVLESAVERAPANPDCWAMLSWVTAHEHAHGFNPRPGSLDRALAAARRAVDLAPSNHLAQQALAVVLFFRRDRAACLSAAERALALNPLDGSNEAIFLVAFTGDWERGCTLIRRAMDLNPHHPRWYELILGVNEYRLGRYRAAVDEITKAGLPESLWRGSILAAAHGQLGDRAAAGDALRELRVHGGDAARAVRDLLEKWFDPQLVEHLVDGLRKASLAAEAPAAAPAPSGGKGAAPVAIAVVPFADLSPAQDQQYFCEGMAEEIMTALVGVEGVRVASRTSAFRARRENADLAGIARALSVGHLLEGSVRTSGTRLRVTAQLTEVASDAQVWSERFDRDAADVFAIQDEIAAGVVEAVRARLAPAARTVRARPRAHDLEAYRSYLKGRHLRHTRNDHGGALSSFEEAVRLDPSHAPSWVGVAEASFLAAHYALVPARAACARASEALDTAHRLQGETAEARYVEGFLAFRERDWRVADASCRRAIELQPSHVQALGSYGVILCTRQRLDEARGFFERAREADPLAAYPYAMTGLGLLAVRRPMEAEGFFEEAISFEKENALALWGSGTARIALGRFEGGIATMEQVAALSRRAAFFLGLLGWAFAAAGRSGDALAVLEELRARPAEAPTAVSEAWLLAALGEADAAFEVIARAEGERQAFLNYTGLPGFDPLRGDDRFALLEERLGRPTGR
jgi:TolB-like protein/Tfp pilus assembly protein PilF